jgi:hypothetical protein
MVNGGRCTQYAEYGETQTDSVGKRYTASARRALSGPDGDARPGATVGRAPPFERCPVRLCSVSEALCLTD